MTNSSLGRTKSESTSVRLRDMKLEVVVIPVADAERSKAFYASLGWRLDMDFKHDEGFRVIQFTPPGSQCSIIFGKGITAAVPGFSNELLLAVTDIEEEHSRLLSIGVQVTSIFHDAGGIFHHINEVDRVLGPAPGRRSYGSYASFNDPDGNTWTIQEITVRLPGHVDTQETTYTSADELAAALHRAEAAHKEFAANSPSKSCGDWAGWYANYLVGEQSGYGKVK